MTDKIVISQDKLVHKFTDEQLELKKTALKNMIKFFKVKNFDQMVEIAQNILNFLPTEALGEGDNDISEIYFLYATALKESGKEIHLIRQNAVKSFHFNRANKNSLWLIRELDNIVSTTTKFFRLQVLGKFYRMYNKEEIQEIFRTIYSVAADNENQALEFIQKYDRPEITQDIELIKSFDLGFRADLPQGIYETIKLMLWVEQN